MRIKNKKIDEFFKKLPVSKNYETKISLNRAFFAKGKGTIRRGLFLRNYDQSPNKSFFLASNSSCVIAPISSKPFNFLTASIFSS